MALVTKNSFAAIGEVAVPIVVGALVDSAPIVIGAIAASELLLGICIVGTFVLAAIVIRKAF